MIEDLVCPGLQLAVGEDVGITGVIVSDDAGDEAEESRDVSA